MSSKPSQVGWRQRAVNADEVSVVEAAYRLDGTEMEWLEWLASAAAPLFGESLGVTASTWTPPHTLRTLAAVGGPHGFPAAVGHALKNSSPELKLGFFRSAPVTSLSGSGAARFVAMDPASQALLGLGVRDSISVFGGSLADCVVNLQVYLPGEAQLSRRFASRWSRIASHLAAGLRVRNGLSGVGVSGAVRPDPIVGSEAILTPNGKLAHAENSAKSAHAILARAVVDINRARGRTRGEDPDAALDLWRGLVAGRWSLLEHFDTDGKRLLVARKNEPDTLGPEALNARQRQVLASRARGMTLKLIGYDLGLSVSSVSRILSSGMAKLGMAHGAELAALFSHVEKPDRAPRFP